MDINNNNIIHGSDIVNDPNPLVLMGLDVSPRHCGIAITDTQRIVSRAIGSIQWNNRKFKKLLYTIIDLIKQYNVVGVVIGLPVNVYDVLPKSKNYIKTMAHNLKQITGLPFFFQEEHLSTVMSTSFLRGDMTAHQIKIRQNHIAATYILQCFLDENRKNVNNNN